MSETFIKIDSLQHLEISRRAILRTGQKSALQYSLFWRHAKFSKLMRTIHISMTSSVSIVNVLHSKDAVNSWSWDTGVCNFVPRDRILMYRTWTISDQIVFLFEQFFCYLIAGTLLYDLYCRCLRRNVRSLIKKHCSVISIMSRLSNVCVFRHTGHRLSESESISSSDRTRDTIYSICSV